MSNIEEQNLTEFLLEVKAKMANITTSENIEINNINEYVLKNIKETRKMSVIFEAVSLSLAGSNKVQTLFLEKSNPFFLDITFSDK